MAFVPNFQYDIFISYAHVDNQLLPGETEGWITRFQEYLTVYLSRRVGRMGIVKIWRDPNLDGSELFDNVIEDRIKQSALFLALTSTGYLDSEYCRQELTGFSKKASLEPAGLSAGDRMRILNVLINNIPHTSWPEQYGRTSGYPFYESENEEDLGYPLRSSAGAFEDQLRRLVEAIYRTLQALKGPAPAAASNKPPQKTVFIADTADSLSLNRKRLLNDLRQNDSIRIVSNIPPPFEAAAHEQKIIEAVTQADLSVHLLDNLPGREIQDSEGKSYSQRQVELGLQYGKAQFVWAPQTLDAEAIEDESYRNFIDQLQNGNRGEAKYCFVRGSASSISREVLEMLERPTEPPPNGKPALPSAALVDTHLKDQLHAYHLGQYLIGKSIQPYINPEEDDPQLNMKVLEERLKQVTKLIVIFGDVAEDWVRARLGVALQIAVTEKSPLNACGVYFAPPRQRSAQGLFNLPFLPVYEFDNRDMTSPASLAPIFGGQ